MKIGLEQDGTEKCVRYAPKGFRWIQYDEKNNRLELNGCFESGDLKNLAAWLDDPKHPCVPGTAFMKVSLSNINV